MVSFHYFLASFTTAEKPVIGLITTPLDIICHFALYLRECVSYVRACESDENFYKMNTGVIVIKIL